ncbi:hypothetical protein Emed_004508 [Eimeria media]
MGGGGRGTEEGSATRASAAIDSTAGKEGRLQQQSPRAALPPHSKQQAAAAAKHASFSVPSSVTQEGEKKGGRTSRTQASMHTSKVVSIKADPVTEKQQKMSSKAVSSASAAKARPQQSGAAAAAAAGDSPQPPVAAAAAAGAAAGGGSRPKLRIDLKPQQRSKSAGGSSSEESAPNQGGGDDCQSLSTCTLTNRMGYRSRTLSVGSPSSSSEEGEEVPSPAASVLAIDVETPPKSAERKTSENSILWVFALVLLLEIFVNFDSGVVPAILPTLEKEFHLVGTTEGLLGALPYIGLGFSSPFVGRGLTLFSPKYFCFFTMLVNVLATGLFGLAAHKWMLFFARLLLGLTQAGFSIYAPVWVDRFAPRDKLTLWMGLTQGGVVIGTVLGCVTAGALDAARRSGMSGAHWRYALLIQFLWLLTLVIVWGLTPRYLLEIDLNNVEEESETSSIASVQEGSDENEQISSGEDISSEEELKPSVSPAVSPAVSVPTSATTSTQQQQPKRALQPSKSTPPPRSLLSSKLSIRRSRGSSAAAEQQGGGRRSRFDSAERDEANGVRRPTRLSHRHSASRVGGGGSSRPAIMAVGRAHSVGDPSHQPRGLITFPNSDFRGEGAGGGPNNNNNSFQYQMTFLTPHPTTLAFEALNWASGTQDPMLLVQRDNRQVAAKGTDGPHSSTAGEGRETVTESNEGGANSSSVAAVSQKVEEAIDNDLEKNIKTGTSEPSGLQASASEMPVSKPARVAKTLGVRECVRILLSSPLYVCVTFSLCALFFEVTAIQFWSITYFQQLLKHSTGTVLIAFNITAATAPITGVLAGGWFIDFLGGYKDDRGMRILPAATGIVIASVPLEVRAFGSGFCMMVFNVLGYVLGTFLPGLLIEAFSLLWGMRVIYMWSLNGVLGFALARWFLRRLELQPAFVPETEQLQWPPSSAAENKNNSIKESSCEEGSAVAVSS